MTATLFFKKTRSRSGEKTKTIFPVSELGAHFEHALLLNGDYGGPGALYYLCVTTCEYHNKPFAPALPIIHLGGLPEASDKLGILFPESGPPGTPGSCASHMGTTSLLFRDILPRWVLRARPTAKLGLFRSDMTFRQAMEHSCIFQ